MTRIAVTGTTGFVGRHLVDRLLTSGYDVRVLVRTGSNAPARARAETMWGDVKSVASVQALVAGCQAVVHLASTFSNDDHVTETVVAGTENVVAACKDAGVDRLLFMSCLGADASARSSLYAAKWKAETLVRSAGVPFTIVRPSLVMGRGDGVTAPLAALIRALPVVPVPGTGQHRVQPIDVEDLTRCISQALEDDSLVGETVSVGGPLFLTFRQIVDLIGSHIGSVKPKVLVPERALPVVARLLPHQAGALYSRARVHQFQHGVVASPGIVPRIFGFEPRSMVRQLEAYLA